MKSPVTIITGFLGSGKTTLINALVGHPSMAGSAVIVNEFGEIGVDHLLIEHLDEATMLVGAGCLCCEVREDVVVAILRLLDRRAADHILIETSGLADPAPLVHTLLHDERINRQVSVAGIVATVDAQAGERSFETQRECLRQAAVADTIILTKTDLAPGTDRLEARLRALNDEARILSSPVTPEYTLRHVPGPSTWIHASSSTHHDSTITSLSLTTHWALEAASLMDWIKRLIARQGDRLLRFKGIVDLLGQRRADRHQRHRPRLPPPLPPCRMAARHTRFTHRPHRTPSRHSRHRGGILAPGQHQPAMLSLACHQQSRFVQRLPTHLMILVMMPKHAPTIAERL